MKQSVFAVFLILVLILPCNVEAQRGCCSYHGGVSGCSSSGKQICNDGTLSPSCTCTPAYIDKNNINNNYESNNDSYKYKDVVNETSANQMGDEIVSTNENDSYKSSDIVAEIYGLGIIGALIYSIRKKIKK